MYEAKISVKTRIAPIIHTTCSKPNVRQQNDGESADSLRKMEVDGCLSPVFSSFNCMLENDTECIG